VSLLVAYVVPEGLLFAADRNLSAECRNVGVAPKVLCSEERGLLLGYVGRASVDGVPMIEWLRGFLDRHPDYSLADVAQGLAEELEAASAQIDPAKRGTIIHVGGFENRPEGPLPAIWYIHDKEIQLDGSFKFLGKFEARDELKNHGDPPYFGDATGEEIRAQLRGSGLALPWASFRQGFDLRVFDRLDRLTWALADGLVGGLSRERVHAAPTTLDEWRPFVEFSVRCYSAYFEAFYPPGQQVVGGGVNVEALAWP
jgi:hypothetical protein